VAIVSAPADAAEKKLIERRAPPVETADVASSGLALREGPD
jgi:hypothetical protein